MMQQDMQDMKLLDGKDTAQCFDDLISFEELMDGESDRDLHEFLDQVFVESEQPVVSQQCNYTPQPMYQPMNNLPAGMPMYVTPEQAQHHHQQQMMFQAPMHMHHQQQQASYNNGYAYNNVVASSNPVVVKNEPKSKVNDDHEDAKSVTSNASDGNGRKIFYRRNWSTEEDAMLIKLVEESGPKNWARLAKQIPGKTGNQLSQRWNKALDPSIKKGKWSTDEDTALRTAVKKHGQKWKQISNLIPGRTGKQCRDRYTARLDPTLKTGRWTPQEEAIVLNAFRTYGNRWATIQKLLPHRSWYTIKWKIESLTKNDKML